MGAFPDQAYGSNLPPLNQNNLVNRSHPLNNGRLAWWLTVPWFAGSSKWYDIIGQNHGTLTTMATANSGWKTTRRPQGFGHVQFDLAGYVNCGTLINPSYITVAAWVNTASFFNSYNTVIGRDTGTNYCALWLRNTGQIAIYINSGAVVSYDGTGAFSLLTNKWYRVAFTYSPAGVLTGYVNGVVDKRASIAATPLLPIASATTIGNDIGTAGRLFSGSIDDVSVWGRALTDAEIKMDYDLSSNGYPGVLNRRSVRSYFVTPAAAPAVTTLSQFDYYYRRRRSA